MTFLLFSLNDYRESMKIFNRNNVLFFMGLGTLVLFPLLAWPVLHFTDVPFWDIFNIRTDEIYLVPVYISAGILFGLFVIWFTELNYFETALKSIKSRLDQFKINSFYVVFLSICAGVGEEVFFRGALQPLIGIWATAFFFVLIHDYFSIKNLRLNFFGVVITIFIAFLGWSVQKYNLWLAIAAHFSYDLILLFYYKYQRSISLD